MKSGDLGGHSANCEEQRITYLHRSMLKFAVRSTIGIQSRPQTCVPSVVHVDRKFILVTERKVFVHLSIVVGNITKFQTFRIATVFYVPGCLSGQ